MRAKPKRTSIPEDLKSELKTRISAMKLEGGNNHTISNELGIAWETVDKYWDEVLEEAGEKVDAVKLIKERRMVTERLVGKSVRDFYAGRSGIKDVAIAMELADRYNTVSKHLVVETPEKMPYLLTITVQNVDIELPPEERQIEQILDTVQ